MNQISEQQGVNHIKPGGPVSCQGNPAPHHRTVNLLAAEITPSHGCSVSQSLLLAFAITLLTTLRLPEQL